jgi:hypothetical protein
MFTKLTKSGGHTYVQLVESFRDENGRPRQRTVSTLGRLDEACGQVDALLKGLLRAKGMPASMAERPQLAFESALRVSQSALHHPGRARHSCHGLQPPVRCRLQTGREVDPEFGTGV